MLLKNYKADLAGNFGAAGLAGLGGAGRGGLKEMFSTKLAGAT
jgi:hypothetical protein